MLIREWMTKDVITVTPDTSMLKASADLISRISSEA